MQRRNRAAGPSSRASVHRTASRARFRCASRWSRGRRGMTVATERERVCARVRESCCRWIDGETSKGLSRCRRGGGEKEKRHNKARWPPHHTEQPPTGRRPPHFLAAAVQTMVTRGAGATHKRARPGHDRALSAHPVAAGPVPFTRTHRRTRTKRSDHRRRFASARSSFPDHLFDRVRRRRRRRRRSRHCHSRNSRGAVAVAVVSRARFRVLFP